MQVFLTPKDKARPPAPNKIKNKKKPNAIYAVINPTFKALSKNSRV
jgi:hypothetical protein